MQDLLAHVDRKFLGNTLGDWLLAMALFTAIFLAVEFVRGVVRSRRRHWDGAASPALELLGGMAAATSRLVVISVALYFSEKLLQLPPKADRVFAAVIVAGVAVQLALWATVALRFAVHRHYGGGAGEDRGARASVGALLFIGQLVIWAVFALLALDNLGINITTLVAGLGVGGIAVALAVQTILSDLFGSMSIALDKPFVVGDQLRIDDVEGTVEYIGIKSTRLRSLTGEQIILSNADVLKSRVRNLGRMAERRVLFRLGVTYETPPDKLDRVADIVRQAVQSVPDTRFVQCPLMSLGADSLEFELIFHVANRPDVSHGQTVGMVNRGIFRAFAEAGIDFAYPTRRLLVEQAPPADSK
jgi:small-conductance mechanosensitive channel